MVEQVWAPRAKSLMISGEGTPWWPSGLGSAVPLTHLIPGWEFRSHKESLAQLSKEGGSFTPRQLMREPLPNPLSPSMMEVDNEFTAAQEKRLAPKKEGESLKKKMV